MVAAGPREHGRVWRRPLRSPGGASAHATAARLITVEAWSSPELEWIQSTLRYMAVEAREPRPGGETVITRLADILVIQVIRAWIARDPSAQRGWLGALRDRRLVAPWRWSIAILVATGRSRRWRPASGCRDPRSRLASRSVVGEPAMRYVARWRMQAARLWLQEGDDAR